jgi:hypothetical protein
MLVGCDRTEIPLCEDPHTTSNQVSCSGLCRSPTIRFGYAGPQSSIARANTGGPTAATAFSLPAVATALDGGVAAVPTSQIVRTSRSPSATGRVSCRRTKQRGPRGQRGSLLARRPITILSNGFPSAASRHSFAGTLIDQQARLNHLSARAPRAHDRRPADSAGERKGAWATRAHLSALTKHLGLASKACPGERSQLSSACW